MNKFKLLFLVSLVFILACNNSESENITDTDSVNVVTDSNNIDTNNDMIISPNNDNTTNNNQVTETPDEIILAENIPPNASLFTNAGIDDDVLVYSFIRKIRANKGNKNTLSEMIAYPINPKIDGVKTQITNTTEFLNNFDKIFNSKIIETLENVDYNNIFSNYQGVMLGNGEIWMGLIDSEIKIIAINN